MVGDVTGTRSTRIELRHSDMSMTSRKEAELCLEFHSGPVLVNDMPTHPPSSQKWPNFHVLKHVQKQFYDLF